MGVLNGLKKLARLLSSQEIKKDLREKEMVLESAEMTRLQAEEAIEAVCREYGWLDSSPECKPFELEEDSEHGTD